MMRVLMVLRRFPPVSFGGGELSALTLVRGLLSRGIGVTVLTGRGHPGADAVPLPSDLRSRLTLDAALDPGPRGDEAAWNHSVASAVRRIDRHDILHVHDPRLIPGAVRGAGGQTPAVATINDLWPTCYYSMHYRRGDLCPSCSLAGLFRCLDDWGGNRLAAPAILAATRWRTRRLMRLDGVLARSDEVRDILRRNGVNVPTVVTWPLVEDVFTPTPVTGTGKIGYVGRVDRGKGVDLAIRALAHLDGPELIVAGGGPYTGEYRSLAERVGVGDRVRFIGPVPHSRVPRLFRDVDLVLVPSARVEPMPRALIEAAMAGRAVVVSDITGGVEIVLDGTSGRVFRAGSVPALVEAVTPVLEEDTAARMGRAAREHIERIYSADRIVDDVAGFYVDVLQERAPVN